jgi:hypothetical protein
VPVLFCPYSNYTAAFGKEQELSATLSTILLFADIKRFKTI